MAQINLTAELEPQPTLSIYFGGTGVQTGQMLWKMLSSVSEPVARFVEPFFIDSQAPKISHYERSRHYSYRDLNRFEEPVYEEFREHRMPRNLGREPVMDSSDGCGVTRIFGAASLAECRDDFINLVSDAVRRLQQCGVDSNQPLQVFLTASACGGTGAGMLIDAAALIRHHLAEGFNERPRIYAFVVGPGAFDHVLSGEDKKSRMMASAYAMLGELHHFADGGTFRSGYRLRDKPIEIRNDIPGDRLFEWIFYVDGKTEGGAVVRSQEELCWIVAEFQMHFALSLVGRGIRESVPNLREHRARRYPADFIHPESREGRPKEEERILGRASRRCFLASLSVRGVRFPADEIAEFERARWSAEAIEALLERDFFEEKDPLLVMDRLLGVEAGELTHEGLLARCRATPLALLKRVPSASAGWSAPRRQQDPQAIYEQGKRLLEESRTLLERRGSSAEVTSDGQANQAFRGWNLQWKEEVGQADRLPRHFFELAGDATQGRGLRWLRNFLDHVVAFLESPRPESAHEAAWEELAALREKAVRKHGRLGRAVRKDERNPLVRGRVLIEKLFSEGRNRTFSSSETARLAAATVDPLTQLANAAQKLEQRIALPELERRVYRQMADDLKTWRRQKLDPILETLTTASIDAKSRRQRRQAQLAGHPKDGSEADARYSVHSLVDDDLLKDLRAQAATRPSMIDFVVRPFFADGLVYGQHRLGIDTVQGLEAKEVVEIVEQIVRRSTRAQLESLQQGWQLPAVQECLGRAAVVLDQGATPLVAHAEGALGLSPLRFLVLPDELKLDNPFGQSFGVSRRLVGRDHLQLNAISVVFGIPPNTLTGVERWFRHYCLHLGDDGDRGQLDRFPLHVFRGAATEFNEIYSPLDLGRHPGYVEGLRDLVASPDWDDTIQLDIRPQPDLAAALDPLHDWNLVIELTDRVVRAAQHRPTLEARVLEDPRLRPLARRIYGGTHFEDPGPNGSGDSPRPYYGGNGNAQSNDSPGGNSKRGSGSSGHDDHPDR